MAQYQEFLTFAETLADAAGRVITPLFRALPEIISKQDASPVTIADREAERIMREMINAHYPTHGIIGEEFGNEREDAEFCWTLDPIDGTASFIIGRPI